MAARTTVRRPGEVPAQRRPPATAAAPPHQRSRVDPSVRRRGIVYGLNILDPRTGRIRLDYVGKTRQRLRSREIQHREDQPFSDLIVGDAVVVEQGMWTEPELDAREQAAVQRLRPRYNYEYNLANPDRITIPEARAQRWARDDAAGRPRWLPPGERPVTGPTVLATPGRLRRAWWWFRRGVRRTRRAPRRTRRPVLAAALWLALAGGLWWALAGAWDAPGAAAGAGVGATAVVAYARFGRRRSRKRRRR